MLAVKLYKDVPNCPKGMPKEWPAEVLEIGQHECPSGYVAMTREQYSAHRAQLMPEYLAWEEKADPKGLRAPGGRLYRKPWWKFWVRGNK